MENSNQENSRYESFSNIANLVIKDLYPAVFESIHNLAVSLKSESFLTEDELLKSHLEWIHNSLDELFRKEKFLMFPYLLKQSENESKHLPDFNWVTTAHKQITNKLHGFKLKIVRIAINTEKENLVLQQLIVQVNLLESQYLELQITVEEKLLSHFESAYLKNKPHG